MARRTVTFVGRRAQVALLDDVLSRAAEGTPSAVLLAGDAGVGKSALVRHAGARAEAAGARVVVAHCVDLGEIGVPYLPFAEVVAQLRDLEPDVVRDVARNRPALGLLLPGAGQEEAPGDGSAARLQLFDGLAEVIGCVATRERPLLLVVEDVHWADASSRDVLRYLVARLRDQPVVLVATYRTDDLHRRHPWRPVAAELGRSPYVTRIDLPAFTDDEVRELTVAITGTLLPEATVQRVVDRSGGNAYFAEELIEAGVDGELPWSLTEVLRTRLDQLPAPVQHLARVASVAGRRVREPLLRAAASLDGDALLGGPGAFDDALREAIARHVLVVEDGEIAFRHALLGETVEADLLPGEVSSLHGRYLRALQADPSLGSSSQLASHALRAPDLPVAFAASRDAATQAHDLLAPAEELRHLEVVLRLWQAVGATEAKEGECRSDVLARAATAAGNAGQIERSVQLARAAVDETEDVHVRAGRRAALAVHLMAMEHLAEAYDEAARAVAELPPEPSRERAWALATYARAALNYDHDRDAREHATLAVEVARASGAAGAESDALTTLAVLEVNDADLSAELLRQALDRARAAADWGTEMRASFNLASNRYYAGDLPAAAALSAEAVEHARMAGISGNAFATELQGMHELIRFVVGDLTPGPSRPSPSRDRTGLYTVTHLYSAVARGDDDAVEQGRALEQWWDRDGLIALIGGGCTADALTWRGEHDEAVALAQRVIEHVGRTWNEFFLGGIWLGALALAALADAAAAERLAGVDVTDRVAFGDAVRDRAVHVAQRGRPRDGPLGPEGRAWLARVHAEHGRLHGGAANDPALWRAAVEAFDYGYAYEVARTRYRLAESLLEHGDRDAARDEATRALESAEKMGAVPLASALRALSRRGRLGLPGGRSAGGDVLTDREAEVLALVARGLSNRQIGEELFISGKTVSVHVSNVLAKLGASGRAEAVTIAHQRGLLTVG